MTEPGWYRDTANDQLARWHDGEGWTRHTIVMAEHPGGPPGPPQEPVLASWPTAPVETTGVEPTIVKGQNGTVTFDGRFVTIERKGLMARATVGKGTKRIPVKSITAVQWRPASKLTTGYIQFTVPGGNEVRSRPGHANADARTDENSVTFMKTQEAGFEQLRAVIENAMA